MKTAQIQQKLPEDTSIEIDSESIEAHCSIFNKGIKCKTVEEALRVCVMAAKIEKIHDSNGGW